MYRDDRIQFNAMNTVLCMQTMCYQLYDINSQNISDLRIAPAPQAVLAELSDNLEWKRPNQYKIEI